VVARAGRPRRPARGGGAPAALGQDLADSEQGQLARPALDDLDEPMKVDERGASRPACLHGDANPSLAKNADLDVEGLAILAKLVDDVAHHDLDLPLRWQVGVPDPTVRGSVPV